MENNSTQSKKEPEIIQPESTELVETVGPKPPKGMSNEEAQRIKKQSEAMIKQLSEVSGSKELEILDNMANMGVQTQRNAAGYLDLLKARVSTFLSDGGPSREIADSMRDLRIALDEIDPHAPPKTMWARVYRIVPFFGRANPVRMLHKIALRYEPVSRQIA